MSYSQTRAEFDLKWGAVSVYVNRCLKDATFPFLKAKEGVNEELKAIIVRICGNMIGEICRIAVIKCDHARMMTVTGDHIKFAVNMCFNVNPMNCFDLIGHESQLASAHSCKKNNVPGQRAFNRFLTVMRRDIVQYRTDLRLQGSGVIFLKNFVDNQIALSLQNNPERYSECCIVYS